TTKPVPSALMSSLRRSKDGVSTPVKQTEIVALSRFWSKWTLCGPLTTTKSLGLASPFAWPSSVTAMSRPPDVSPVVETVRLKQIFVAVVEVQSRAALIVAWSVATVVVVVVVVVVVDGVGDVHGEKSTLLVVVPFRFAMSLDLNSTRSVLKSGSRKEDTSSKQAVYVVVPGTMVNDNSAPVSTKTDEPGV